MTSFATSKQTGLPPWRTWGAADWLGLAASPVFALMGWITSGNMSVICAPMSHDLPISGMTMMYLLMSLFHLPAWLRLVTGRTGTGR